MHDVCCNKGHDEFCYVPSFFAWAHDIKCTKAFAWRCRAKRKIHHSRATGIRILNLFIHESADFR